MKTPDKAAIVNNLYNKLCKKAFLICNKNCRATTNHGGARKIFLRKGRPTFGPAGNGSGVGELDRVQHGTQPAHRDDGYTSGRSKSQEQKEENQVSFCHG